MQSWYTIRAQGEGAELLIYDEIGAYGVSAKSFLADWVRWTQKYLWSCASTAPVGRCLMQSRFTMR